MRIKGDSGSNNTNKLSPQEHIFVPSTVAIGSNNTNKLSPQERKVDISNNDAVQIIQINLVLKNFLLVPGSPKQVQIIQINLVLKNHMLTI